jgi:hypothetical protein
MSFLAKNSAPCQNTNTPQTGQIVNDTFGDAVAQKLGIRIAAVVDERQYGNRVDLRCSAIENTKCLVPLVR